MSAFLAAASEVHINGEVIIVSLIGFVGTISASAIAALASLKTRAENKGQHSGVSEKVDKLASDVVELMATSRLNASALAEMRDILTHTEKGWEARAHSILDSLPVPSFEANANGEATYVSRAWVEETGIDAKSAMGYGWVEGIHPDDRAAVADAWNQAVAAGTPFGPMVYRFGHSHRPFSVWATPIIRTDGTTVYVGQSAPVLDSAA